MLATSCQLCRRGWTCHTYTSYANGMDRQTIPMPAMHVGADRQTTPMPTMQKWTNRPHPRQLCRSSRTCHTYTSYAKETNRPHPCQLRKAPNRPHPCQLCRWDAQTGADTDCKERSDEKLNQTVKSVSTAYSFIFMIYCVINR